MENVRLKREDLLAKLCENRELHKAEFIEAKEKWTRKAAKALRKAADQAERIADGKKGRIDTNPLVNLPKPQSYIESYDDAIARVEADVRDELELDDRTFAAWYQDNWSWRGAFAANTSLYNGR